MTRRTKLIIAVAAVALLATGGGVLAFVKKGGAEAKDVAKAQRGPLEVVLAETGRIEAMTQVEVKSKVAGQVARILVDVGQKVAKGQLLIELDTAEMQRQRAQAAADRDMAQARLAKLVAGARREELTQARAQLARARAAYERARDEDRRAQTALATQTITPVEAGQARNTHLQAQAQHDEARATLAMLLAGTRREELAEARAQLARASAALAAMADQVAYASIKAPMAGTVIKRGIEVGEMVSPGVSATAQGTSMLTIADLERLVIKSSLNQIDVGKVSLGQTVDVRVDAAPGKAFPGRIYKIAPAAEAGKDDIRTFPIETILNAAGADGRFLKPGMSAELDVRVAKKADALYLPVEAVVRGKGDEGTVTLAPAAKGEEAREQKVRIGLTNDHQIEILEGLAAGQSVLIKPPASDSKAKT